MKILFALGNHGNEYTGTRHNVGFAALDTFGASHSATFAQKSRFKAEVAEITIEGEKVLLVKPLTFYNLAGESYRALIDFYKAEPEDVLIVHDELALPFGTIRNRVGGSDAGNNGIKSINQHGGEATARLRVGVANEQRAVMGDTDFVLGRLSKEEAADFSDTILPKLVQLMNEFISGEHSVTSHRVIDKSAE